MTLTAPPRTPIGVGIVGLSASGGWAANAHVPALARLEGYEVRALAASNPTSAAAAAQKYGIGLAFDNAAELADNDQVDLVVITVKVPQHRELVMAALAAGKSVLCEWPLGNGLVETEQLAAEAAKRKIPSFVGLQARSAPVIRYLHDLVADGYVGEVLSTTVVGSGGSWGAEVDGRNEYTLDRDNGATMLTIPFGHTIDALTMVLGEFSNVSATTATRRHRVRNATAGHDVPMTAEDQIAVTGVLETGALAALHFRGGASRGTNLLWEINGTEGDLVLTGDTGHLQLANVTLSGGRASDRGLSPMHPPTQYELVPRERFVDLPRAYNVASAYAQILTDLTTGTKVAPTFAHAVRRHALLELIQSNAQAAATPL